MLPAIRHVVCIIMHYASMSVKIITKKHLFVLAQFQNSLHVYYSLLVFYGAPERTWCYNLVIRPDELLIRPDGLLIRPDELY